MIEARANYGIAFLFQTHERMFQQVDKLRNNSVWPARTVLMSDFHKCHSPPV